ncbi:MAG TPA: hypothetical protein VMT94_05235 [Burkholderiales bacterium]|nr:hypothetical protein [Burkholderiales bacterium]
MDWRGLLTRAGAALRARLDALGTAGVVGLGLLVFDAAMFTSSVLPSYGEMDRLKAQFALYKHDDKSMPGGMLDMASRSGRELEQFARYLPTLGEAPALIMKLHEIAAQNSLQLGSGEYRLTQEPDSNVMRYQIVLPLHGSYVQARLFIAQALDEVSPLTLEEVAIKRASVGDRNTETSVRFVMYLMERKS